MQNLDEKRQVINVKQATPNEINKLLTESDIIELHLIGKSESERLREVKNLYQMTKKEYDRIGQYVLVRKTYQLKSASVNKFSELTLKKGIKPRICISELMIWYMDAVKNQHFAPAPATYDSGCEYKHQSYRILNATATSFHTFCCEQHLSVSHVLQALIDYYISKKGEIELC